MRPERLRRAAALLLAGAATSALGGEAAIALQNNAAYHRLTVPLPVLSQTRTADLRDVQVLNARGEPVPHAWVDEATAPITRAQMHRVPFFKAPAAASATAASQQGGWVLDVRGAKGALVELQLSLPSETQGIYGFVLEHSDDLQQWRTHLGSAQLISLQRDGMRLEHRHFELNGLHARYLRLRPHAGSAVPPLSGAQVTSTARHTPAPALQWSEPLAPTHCNAQHCDYALPRHLPLERLQWQLAEANTLAPLDLLVQHDTRALDELHGHTAPPHAHHRRRHALRERLAGVRHKTAPAAAEVPASWQLLQRTTAYWLRLPEGEVRSPELAPGGVLATQLRVQPLGGMVQLGPRPPLLRVGARPASLVFLAREPAPYRLVWGGPDSTSALPLAQLMPLRQAGDPLPADTATVQVAASPVGTASPLPVSPAARAAGQTHAEPSRRLWLWAVLLAALGLMGLMAWALLRPTTKT